MFKFKMPAAAKRGFGLVDVSLGLIVVIGVLSGGFILFQQINTNNSVAEVSRNSVTISSEIRAAARNLADFDELAVNPGTDNTINLVNFGMEPAMISGVDAEANGQQFQLDFGGMTARSCQRAQVNPANLGVNVAAASCVASSGNASDPVDTLRVIYNR